MQRDGVGGRGQAAVQEQLGLLGNREEETVTHSVLGICFLFSFFVCLQCDLFPQRKEWLMVRMCLPHCLSNPF